MHHLGISSQVRPSHHRLKIHRASGYPATRRTWSNREIRIQHPWGFYHHPSLSPPRADITSWIQNTVQAITPVKIKNPIRNRLGRSYSASSHQTTQYGNSRTPQEIDWAELGACQRRVLTVVAMSFAFLSETDLINSSFALTLNSHQL